MCLKPTWCVAVMGISSEVEIEPKVATFVTLLSADTAVVFKPAWRVTVGGIMPALPTPTTERVDRTH